MKRAFSQEKSEKTGGNNPLLRVENLTVVRGAEQRILDDISFSVYRGEIFGLLGESSAGKTTLARAILRVLPEELRQVSGLIYLENAEISALSEKRMREFWGRKISYLPQNAGLALNPVFRLRSQMYEIVRTRTNNKDEQKKLMENALRQMRLPADGKFLRQYPFQLSGGQQQRFLLAELLVAQPELLIADEPTSALDMPLQQEIVHLLKRMRNQFGITVIFISHDLAVVEELADRIGILYRGKLVEVQEANTLIHNPKHPYTKQMVELQRSMVI